MKKHQSGSVLAISLVLLTAITIMALMGLQRSGLQNKIVANIQHKELAFRKASFTAEDEVFALNDLSDENLRKELEKATSAFYASKENSSASESYTYSRQDNLSNYSNKTINSRISLTQKTETSRPDVGITKRRLGEFSRGHSGYSDASFELIADVQIPNGMQAAFAIGFKLDSSNKKAN